MQIVDLLVGSLNVRSLVESSGDAHVCRSRPAANGSVDRKLDRTCVLPTTSLWVEHLLVFVEEPLEELEIRQDIKSSAKLLIPKA